MLLALVGAACLSCSTTTFQSTWRNPEAQPLQLANRKVAAVFITRDGVLRRRAEDAMAREITARGAEGVPAYTFLTDAEIKDPEAAKAKASSLGFSGAAVMRVVGSHTVYRRTTGLVWIGAPYHHLWGGYWGWGWGTIWSPGYPSVERIVKVETLVYSLEQDQLVWAGVSRTFDPGHIEDFISELAVAVSEQLKKEGLITRI